IRPLTFGGDPPRDTSRDGRWAKPRITIAGRRMLYEICLRPRFFLALSRADRLITLAHELWHIGPAFDRTLSATRRHQAAAERGGAAERWQALALTHVLRRRLRREPRAGALLRRLLARAQVQDGLAGQLERDGHGRAALRSRRQAGDLERADERVLLELVGVA